MKDSVLLSSAREPLRYLSVCSGIEAATVAWRPLGWKAVAFAEIEKFPSAALAHHYPEVPNLGDITKFRDWPNTTFNVLVGGTPCQSFSVAGLRAGLADPRGNLALTYLAIADRYRPEWLVWENVPGVLSSGRGRDFGTFLGALGQLGYGWAYRSLDAQYFGLAQRRKRVFVVAHLGDWRRAAAVLFDGESMSRNPPPRCEAGQGFAHELAPCIGASGRWFDRTGDTRGQDAVVAMTLNAHGGRMDGGSETFVTHALRADGFDASEDDGTGRGTPLVVGTLLGAAHSGYKDERGLVAVFDPNQITSKANRSTPTPGLAHTLPSHGTAPVAFDMRGRDGGSQFEGPHDTANIRAASGGSSRGYVAAMSVRRLTPRECERLQGFPDDYTLVPYRGKPAADGPRYKALGNSMAVPVVRWIGSRIV